MFCDRCGSEIRDNESFCSKCGNPIGKAPVLRVGSRLNRHLRLLGILWLVLSALRLIPGLVLMSMFGQGRIPADPDIPVFVHGMLWAIGAVMLAIAVLGIATGWALLTRQPWGRMLAIILGCISLIDIPIGTAMGIYTLWVLLPAESEQEYRQLAHAS